MAPPRSHLQPFSYAPTSKSVASFSILLLLHTHTHTYKWMHVCAQIYKYNLVSLFYCLCIYTTNKKAHPWKRLNFLSAIIICSSLSRNGTPRNFHPSTLICPLIWFSLVCTTFSRKDCSPSRFPGSLPLTTFLPLLPQHCQNHRCRGGDLDVSM